MKITRKDNFKELIKKPKYPNIISDGKDGRPYMEELCSIDLSGITKEERIKARELHFSNNIRHKYGCSRYIRDDKKLSFRFECICGKTIKIDNLKERDITEFKAKLFRFTVGISDWYPCYLVNEEDDTDKNLIRYFKEDKIYMYFK